MSEKVCVNLTPVEVGQIDTLVAQGVYTTRTDAIRAGVRLVLDQHAGMVEQGMHRIMADHARLSQQIVSGATGIGVFVISKGQLEDALEKHQRIRIAVVGMVTLANDISVELAAATIERVAIFGS
ncbi:MAG: hypothetical protein ACRDFX_07600, partial [Chloroflexota bacterium]